LIPDDWKYIAEGGKHVVFAFRGGLNENIGTDDRPLRRPAEVTFKNRIKRDAISVFEGFVLRIAKADLARHHRLPSEGSCNDPSPSHSLVDVYETDSDVPNDYVQDSEGSTFHDTKGSSQSRLRSPGNEQTATYSRLVLIPRLGEQYLDLPSCLRLSSSFAHNLYVKTIRSQAIPPERLKSWQTTDDSNPKVLLKPFIVATLMRDVTTLIEELPVGWVWKKHVSSKDKSQFEDCARSARITSLISIEIKPKAGYLSLSPLIHPKRRCKLNHTRYEINQQLMAQGHFCKGWGCPEKELNSSGVSRYDPRDMFSGDRNIIRKAMNSLMDSMQNNLKIWHGGRLLLGHGVAKPGERVFRSILGYLLPGQMRFSVDAAQTSRNGDDEISLERRLKNCTVEIVSSILAKEPLLQRLLALQLLDIVDADGAISIFNRLVELCDGSTDQAEGMLDIYCCNAIDCDKEFSLEGKGDSSGRLFQKADADAVGAVRNIDELLIASPYKCPSCPALNDLLREISRFRTLVDFRREDDFFLDESHRRASKCIDSLSKNGCLYFLGNWLLSLGMSDVSFFVTIEPISRKEVSDKCVSCDGLVNEPCLDQSKSNAGVVSLMLQHTLAHIDGDDSASLVSFAYALKLVDYDPKPALKLRQRDKIEAFVEFYKAKQEIT